MFIATLALAGALLQAPAAIDKAAVSGRVVEQDTQAPIAGAQVMLAILLEGPPAAPFNMRPMMAVTDADGRFTFADVDPGRYRVAATKAGFASPGAPLSTPPIELAAGARRDDVVVAMQRGGVIAGRILDPSGEPVVDMRVMALRKMQPQANAPAAPQAGTRASFSAGMFVGSVGGQTNDLGEFRVHSLAPGEYYLQAMPIIMPVGPGASAPAGTPIIVPTFFPGTPDAASAQTIAVTAGQTTGDIVMRMVSAAAFDVSGTVVDETGQPVAGALVRIAPQRETRMPFGGLPNQARTDEQGTFTLRNVINGTYTLIATPARPMAGTGAGAGAGVGVGVGAGTGGGVGNGAGTATWTSFMAVNGGPGVGTVMMQSADGAAVQYRDDAGTQLPVVVNDASVTGLQVVTRRSAAQ